MIVARRFDLPELPAHYVAQWQEWQKQQTSFHRAFASYTFAKTLHSFVPVTVIAYEEDHQLVALLPGHKAKGIAGRFGRFVRLAGELSDFFAPVVKPGYQLKFEEFLNAGGFTYCHFTHLPNHFVESGFLAQQQREGLRIDISAGSEIFLAEHKANNKKLAKDTARRARQLESEVGEVRFELDCRDNAELERLVTEKRSRYAENGVDDPMSQPWVVPFLKALFDQRDSSCEASLQVMWAGDQWVASHFGLSCYGVLNYWFPVYNEALKRYAPGRLLLKETIANAETLELTLIDRGEGVTRAKEDFATDEQIFCNGVWQANGLIPKALALQQSLMWRLGIEGRWI